MLNRITKPLVLLVLGAISLSLSGCIFLHHRHYDECHYDDAHYSHHRDPDHHHDRDHCD